MNTTDAEIAGIVRKLNGMKCGGAGITNQVLGFLSIYLLNRPMDHVTLGPKDLLAFCRAVVERVDGEPIVMNTPRYSPAPRTFFTVEEIREWILGELIYDGNGNEPEMFKEKNRHTRFLAGYLDDKEDGIAATTERNREEQG